MLPAWRLRRPCSIAAGAGRSKPMTPRLDQSSVKNSKAMVLAFGGRLPCKFDFEDSLESEAVIRLARADGAGDLRCGHASGGRAASRICSAPGLTRSST